MKPNKTKSQKNKWSDLFNNVMSTFVKVLNKDEVEVFRLDTLVALILAVCLPIFAVIFIILVASGSWSFVVESRNKE